MGAREPVSSPISPAPSVVDDVSRTACSLQLPSFPSLSAPLPPPGPSSGENCVSLNDTKRAPKDYETVPYNVLHPLRRRRGCAKKDSKSVLKMDA